MNLIALCAKLYGLGTGFGMAAVALFDPSSPASLKTFGALALFWGASAAVQSLPAPDESSRKLYRFTYSFANLLGANLLHAKVSTPTTGLLAHIAPVDHAAAKAIIDAVNKELTK